LFGVAVTARIAMNEKDSSGPVILVVDDNEVNRELLSTVLAYSGYSVIEASNGLEAVKIATSERPDLIIMDLSMPVLDGFGAVALLRKVPEVRDVPVIACTAHDTSTHRVQALSVGFNEFLPKPIDFNQLNLLVRHFLKAA
jgi:CheY-like chemotaxis protein